MCLTGLTIWTTGCDVQRIKVNVFPKSGYIFKEADGTTITGNTWAGVISRVRLYRKRNNLPAGDPETEVHAQACQRNPSLCIQDDGGTTRRATSEVSLKGRVLKWFAELRKRQFSFVSQEVAKERAAVCKRCPMNTGLPEGCANCRAALNELRRTVLGTGRAGEAALTHHGCSVLGFEQATAVHLDDPTEVNNDLPAHCWKKRTL
jgi:hypothetical protein